MATIKAYTDLEQAKKLAEILPLESANMAWYPSYAKEGYSIRMLNDTYPLDIIGEEHDDIPAWSLAALLNAVDFSTINLHYDNARKDWVASATIHDSTKHCTKYESTRANNLIDACYEIVLKLY